MARRTNSRKNEESENASYEIRPFPLFVILICGIIIIIAGLYLFITNTYARSFAVHSRYGGGTIYPSSLDGTSITILGLLMCVFPVYQLIKQRKK